MNKVNQFLLACFIGQAVILAGLKLIAPSAEERRETSPFENFKFSEITNISIEAPVNQATFKDNSFTLEKAEKEWVLVDAEGYPLEQEKVAGFLAKVKKIRTSELIAESSNYFDRLKVADDEFERKITLKTAQEEITFFIGSANGQDKCHFRLKGEQSVYLSEGLLPWDIYDVAAGWIYPRYFEAPEDDIWSVSLKTRGKTQFAINKNVAGAWTLPNGQLVRNQKKLKAILAKASRVIIDQPIGKTRKPEYGFASPLHELTIRTGTSSITGALPAKLTSEKITFGAEKILGKNKAFFAQKDPTSWVVTIPEWSLFKLNEATFENLLADEK